MNAKELVKRFGNLPPIPDNARHHWARIRRGLREHIATLGPDDFLNWPEITSTMFVGEAPYVGLELSTLRSNGWGRLESALVEDDIGHPVRMSKDNWTSGNLIHQAHHLHAWEQATGRKVDELDCIVEVGGGYGALAKIVRRLGFRGRYVIFDLPEFSLMQAWYLGELGIECEYRADPENIDCDLLVALWSLSEMDSKLQAAYISSIHARHYLVAALDTDWEGMPDNREPLRGLEASLTRQTITHIPGNYYLLG